MSRSLRRWLGLGLVAVLHSAAVHGDAAPRVELFTASDGAPVSPRASTPVRVASLVVYEVDRVADLQQRLSDDLPPDPGTARLAASDRLAALTDDELARARTAAVGLARAIEYGIDRYPAVVIDGRAVVYGIDDVAEALELYNAWREASRR